MAITNPTNQSANTDAFSMLGGGGGGGQGQGQDQAAQVQAIIGKLRQFDSQAQGLAGELPSLAQEAQQIRAIIRRMVQKAGAGMSQSTPSSDALPGGGGAGA
jgi:hypothetical protein